MSNMKNKNFRKLLLLFGSTSALSIIFCLTLGDNTVGESAPLFIQIIYFILMLFLPILYMCSLSYWIDSRFEKKLILSHPEYYFF